MRNTSLDISIQKFAEKARILDAIISFWLLVTSFSTVKKYYVIDQRFGCYLSIVSLQLLFHGEREISEMDKLLVEFLFHLQYFFVFCDQNIALLDTVSVYKSNLAKSGSHSW